MHIKVETKRFDATPREWLELGSECGDLANLWSGRGDIVAYVGQGAGMGLAPALFNPSIAEMELNVDQAFGEGAKPEFIGSLLDRDVQFEQPVACGAILHEAGHAKHSLFDFSKVRKHDDPRISNLVEWFEETRIEARMVEAWPKNRSFLRSSALKLAVDDMDEAGEHAAESNAMQLSKLMLLTMARVTAGVLDEDDVEPVRVGATKALGTDLVDTLEGIWTEAQAHREDEDWQPLAGLAERWVTALEDAGHKTKPSEEEQAAMAAALGEMLDALGELAEDAEVRARTEAVEQAEKEQDEREVEAAAAAAREDAKADEEAGKIFGKSTTDLSTTETKSRLIETRNPTDAERAAAVKISKLLERARYRDRTVTQVASQLPPGRLRTRSAMARSVELSRGAIPTAEPWRRKKRHHTDDPELRIGIMADISGSMRSAMIPMGVATWLFSEAGRRIQARVASVYFGNAVFPGLRSGEHLKQVQIYSAPDGTERFDSAFKAINGEIGLLRSSGARLLVVMSDLHHTDSERKAARKWFTRCAQEGVAVVIMPFEARGYFIDGTIEGLPVRALKEVNDPVEAALAIGTAAAEALTAAGGRG